MRGAAAAAEAAAAVLLVDRIDRIGAGVAIARAARRIALESVMMGIGLSVLGMVAAAFGYLTPVQGALLQEAIDVAVILNALRALRIEPAQGRSVRRAGRSLPWSGKRSDRGDDGPARSVPPPFPCCAAGRDTGR